MSSEVIVTRPAILVERENDPLYYFTALFLSFIQGIFKQRPEGSYKYSEDENLTEIVITDQVSNTKETVPRVITVRGPAQFMTMFTDDMTSMSMKTDERKRTALISIPMTINCIAKIGPEAQELAFFVSHNIWSHRILLQQFGIHKIDRNFSLSPETPTEAIFAPSVVPEGVMVSIIVPFIIRWTVVTKPNNNPKVRELDIFMRTQLEPFLNGKPSNTPPIDNSVISYKDVPNFSLENS